MVPVEATKATKPARPWSRATTRRSAAAAKSSEAVVVFDETKILRRFIKRAPVHQRQNLRRPLVQSNHQRVEEIAVFTRTQRGEPHLPIQTRHVRRAEPRRPRDIPVFHLNSYASQCSPSLLPSMINSGREVVMSAKRP